MAQDIMDIIYFRIGFVKEEIGFRVSLDENNHLSPYIGLRRYVLNYEDFNKRFKKH